MLGATLAIGVVPAFFIQGAKLLTGGTSRNTNLMVEVTAAALLLVVCGVFLTWQYRATLDREAHTVRWTRHVLGFTWTVAVWTRHDVREIKCGRRAGKGNHHVVVLTGAVAGRLLYEGDDGAARSIAGDVKRLLRRPLIVAPARADPRPGLEQAGRPVPQGLPARIHWPWRYCSKLDSAPVPIVLDQQEQASTGQAMAVKAAKILIVEDDPGILQEVADFLVNRKFEVTTSTTFLEGQRALSGGPDIVITDVHLPDGSGLELVSHIQRATPPPPRPRVIVMTGHLDPAGISKALSDGAEAVLLKPFTLRALLQQVRSLLPGSSGGPPVGEAAPA